MSLSLRPHALPPCFRITALCSIVLGLAQRFFPRSSKCRALTEPIIGSTAPQSKEECQPKLRNPCLCLPLSALAGICFCSDPIFLFFPSSQRATVGRYSQAYEVALPGRVGCSESPRSYPQSDEGSRMDEKMV